MSADARNLLLIGMRGAGKTTLGRRLAARLQRPFVDLDDELAVLAELPVDQALVALGEARFRELERQVLRRAAALRGTVLAAGGGAVLGGEDFALLASSSCVVYLEVPPDELLRRQTARPRPALTSLPPAEEIERLLAEREPLYRAAADLVLGASEADPILALLSRLPPRIRG